MVTNECTERQDEISMWKSAPAIYSIFSPSFFILKIFLDLPILHFPTTHFLPFSLSHSHFPGKLTVSANTIITIEWVTNRLEATRHKHEHEHALMPTLYNVVSSSKAKGVSVSSQIPTPEASSLSISLLARPNRRFFVRECNRRRCQGRLPPRRRLLRHHTGRRHRRRYRFRRLSFHQGWFLMA